MGASNLLLQDLAKFCTTEKLLLRVSPPAVLFCEIATANEKVGRPSDDVNGSFIPAEREYMTAVSRFHNSTARRRRYTSN